MRQGSRNKPRSADKAEANSRAEVASDPELPLVWLLMGARAGDNNQLRALAQALGYPFEEKRIEYNGLRHIPLFRRGLTILASQSRSLIRPPWPDLVLCVGYGSVSVARYIRVQTGGRARLVHVGNPREKLQDFDLQITNPQYARIAPNLLELLFPIGNPAKDVVPSAEELQWLTSLPHPRRLIAVGGPARHWRLDHAALAGAIETMRSKRDGSLIVATSPRTTRGTRELLEGLISGRHEAIVEDFPRFAVLLSECDEIHVTADSVSMLSEAVLTGKPVGMIPIVRSARGLLSHWLWERPFGGRTFPDFGNFWRLLNRRKLVGTVEEPIASHSRDSVDRAATAVRQLMMSEERLERQGG